MCKYSPVKSASWIEHECNVALRYATLRYVMSNLKILFIYKCVVNWSFLLLSLPSLPFRSPTFLSFTFSLTREPDSVFIFVSVGAQDSRCQAFVKLFKSRKKPLDSALQPNCQSKNSSSARGVECVIFCHGIVATVRKDSHLTLSDIH